MVAQDESIHVLHVDDEPDFADMSAQFLKRQNERIVVETATSVRDGLERLRNSNIDCIVSDFDMPNQNGIEFLQTVRKTCPELPFILFTGKGSEEVASDAITAGVTDYLQKESGTDQYAVLANRLLNAVERDRIGRELQASQAKYESLTEDVLDTSKVGIFILDANFDVVWINTATETYFGVERDEVIGVDKRQLIKNQIADIFEQPEQFHEIVTATYQDNTYTEEFECHVLSGENRQERWLKHWSQPIETGMYAGGRIEHYSDIMDRKQREWELRRNERRFESMFNDPNILVGLLETDGRVLDINATAMGFIEDTVEEIKGEVFWETPWFEGDKGVQDDIRRWVGQAADGDYVEFEIDISEAIGQKAIVEGVFRPVIDEDGQVESLIISDRDITERRQQEERLETIARRYEAVFDNPKTLIGLLDPDGTLLQANSKALNLVESPADEVIGKPFWKTPWWAYSDDLQERLKGWIDRAAEGEYVHFEADHPTPNGEMVTIEGILHPVRSRDGTVMEILAFGIELDSR